MKHPDPHSRPPNKGFEVTPSTEEHRTFTWVNPATQHKRLVQRCTELLDATDNDLIGVITHVLLETEFFNTDDEEILSWFPADFLRLAIRYLELKQLSPEEAADVQTWLDNLEARRGESGEADG
jgi:hypothetical protein